MKEMMMKNLMLALAFSTLYVSSTAFAIPVGDGDEYKWQKVRGGKEVKSFPVTGIVIAEEGALHMQSARVNGRVLSLLNEEGGIVKKGIPLFSITGPECVSIREEKRIASNSKLEELVASITQRERELNIKVTDHECFILADANGVLVKRTATSGSSINNGDVLAQVLEPERMQIELEIPERSASAITKGSPVKFKMPSVSGFEGKSNIHQVLPIVEAGSRIMKARLQKVALPSGTRLNSLVFADIELFEGKNCLIVPLTAVTMQDNGAWIVKKGHPLKKVSVMVLSNEGDHVLINPHSKNELSEGDLVATYNVPFLFQEVKKQIPDKK